MTSVHLAFSLSQFISSIPLPENEKAARYHYLVYCYGKDKVLGEHYTSYLADFFGLQSDDLIETAHRLSVYLRAYTVVDDDLMDTPPHKADCVWSQLRFFFQNQISEQTSLLGDKEIFADTIVNSELSVYEECSAAYKRHHQTPNVKDLTKSYIDGYADRMATARVPINILGTIAGDEALISEARQGINNLMRALQLLDELVDCEEDLRDGRFTYPLLCYVVSSRELCEIKFSNELSCSSPAGISVEGFAKPESRVMREHLELAYTVLDDASASLRNGVGQRLTSFVKDTRERLGAVLSEYKADSCHADLLKRLRRSGAAPIRSRREKGIRHGFGR